VAYNVVCISATDGAMGEDLGPRVAQALGYRLVNEQIVARAAEEAGVEADVMAHVEKRKSLVARVLQEFSGPAVAGVTYGFSPSMPADSTVAEDDMRGLIRTVIEDVASRGDAVIVSHAASHALASAPDVLRVLMTAGADTRRTRLQASRELSDKDAQKLVTRSDANRADYIKRFYEVAEELPTDYDIVLNSDRLSIDQAVEVVVRAASRA
jgi:cytidylate kinase